MMMLGDRRDNNKAQESNQEAEGPEPIADEDEFPF